jgi:hypothetical protein
MTRSHLRQAGASGTPWRLTAVLRREMDGPEIARESVTDADLGDARSELWLESCLRRGCPQVALDDLAFEIVPLYKQAGRSRCNAFALEAVNPNGRRTRCEFSLNALEHVPARAASRLRDAGVLRAGQHYYYELMAERRQPEQAQSPAEAFGVGGSFTVTARNPPLHISAVPLPPLLDRAHHRGPEDDGWHPVLYTRQAFDKAEHYARKGAAEHPPVETGAVLVGELCSCTRTGEFFVVVLDALEVQEAEQKPLSLAYSGQTWGRIQAVLRARQANPATRGQRLVGQSHGHNFLPADGAARCELCDTLEVCTRTSVFVSSDDLTWSRAVFSRQPWQLCSIHGLNARGESVHGLFGPRDGRLLERGFYLLDELDPTPGRMAR